MAASGKIKYAKLRLFKPSTSGSSKPEVSQENGEIPKEPPASQPEVIDLVDSEPEPDEKLLKRTRLDSREKSPDSPVLRLPKLPRKPPEGASGMISKFFKTSEDDFEPAKKESAAPKAKTKVQRKVTTRKPRAPRKSSQDIRKAFQKYQDNDEALFNDLMVEHSRAEQMDPEQLQLAIAMSRSLSEQHGAAAEDISDSQQPEVGSSASESTLQERRLQGIRTTLEQYGFKCKGNYQDQDLNALFGTPPGPKTGRGRGKTRRKTMLIRRAPEDILAFMNRGAERLLWEELHTVLKDSGAGIRLDVRSYGSDVFWMSENPNLGAGAIPEYFVEGLIESDPAKAGCLLRDWHAIPGRERTPERKRIVPEEKPTENEPPEVADPNLSEVNQDPEDALLDMNTVPDEYRAKYNNQVPLPVQKQTENFSVPKTVVAEAEEDDDEVMTISDEVPLPVPETIKNEKPEEESLNGKQPEISDDDAIMVKSDQVSETEVDPPQENVATKEITHPATPEVVAQASASSPELFEPEDDEREDEDALFLTAPEEVVEEKRDEKEEAPPEEVLCTSSDDMFEDFDPIVDCDMYSSEEVKMSTSSKRVTDPDPLETYLPTKYDATVPPQPQEDDLAAAITLSSGDSNSADRFPLLKRRSSANHYETDGDRGEKEPRLFPTPAKELSFHALALRSRLREVPAEDVETIEVEVEDEAEAEPAEEEQGEKELDQSMERASTTDDDEVISDEEVNYSIQRDYSMIYNVSPPPAESPKQPQEDVPQEDPNATKEYFDLEGFNKRQSDPGTSFRKADNTMAFLDGLIEKFNLPPLAATRRTSCDNKLEDYIEHYEVPDFSDESASEQAVEEVPEDPQPSTQPVISSDQLDDEIEKILNKAKQTCTQLEQDSKMHRTKSDSALLLRKPKSPAPFQDRFKAVLEEPALAPVHCEIRFDNVDPRPDYDAMSLPMLERELFKYGLKQLNRPKAVKILNHIYDQLHPLVELVEDETIEEELPPASSSSRTASTSQGNERKELKKIITAPAAAIIGEGPVLVERRDAFVPEIMDDEPFVLAAKPRKKTFWCSVPLHIAFYNMVKGNPALRRRILRYEPLDLDAIVGHLKEIGLRYDSNEMIAFLDKRCIAFRSAQSNSSGSTAAAGRKKKTGAS